MRDVKEETRITKNDMDMDIDMENNERRRARNRSVKTYLFECTNRILYLGDRAASNRGSNLRHGMYQGTARSRVSRIDGGLPCVSETSLTRRPTPRARTCSLSFR